MSRDDHPFAAVSIFLFGVVVGGITALLAGTDEAGNTRPDVKKKIKLSKQRLVEGGQWAQERTEAIIDYAGELVTSAKKQLAEKLQEIQKKYGEIDKAKYAEAVKEVVEQMKEVGGVTVSQAKTLSKYMMDDYQVLAAAIPKKETSPKKAAGKKAK